MPQLSLYVTDENLARLRKRAEEAGLSMSKYANRLIEQDAESVGWPRDFWSLYGALDEEPAVPEDLSPTRRPRVRHMFE